jgi:hypothetical protein
MAPSLDRDVGALEARLEALEADLRDLKRDVREIRDAIMTVRGGWKLLSLMLAISAALGALLSKLVPWAASLPR